MKIQGEFAIFSFVSVCGINFEGESVETKKKKIGAQTCQRNFKIQVG